jgi:hypothetical protein
VKDIAVIGQGRRLGANAFDFSQGFGDGGRGLRGGDGLCCII